MKKSIFLLLMICGFAISSKADTVEYFHVLLNEKLIFKGISDTIRIKSSSIKRKDSLVIIQYKDSLISDRVIKISVRDGNENPLYTSSGQSNDGPAQLSFKDLLKHKKKSKLSYFNIEIYEYPELIGCFNSTGIQEFRKIFTIAIVD